MKGVRLIAAVGRSGQLGLGGELPWRDPEDLKWFRAQTEGGLMIVGARTLEGLPAKVFESGGRDWRVPLRSVLAGTEEVRRAWLAHMVAHYAKDRTVWIAGGATTYRAFLPFVRVSVVTHVDYDGPGDVRMPNLWKDQP